ncbi:MAG: hypothetical protein QM753_03970 [Thermomicrobiales bacterium]
MPGTTRTGWRDRLRPGRSGRLVLVGAFVVATLAGCGGSGGDDTPTPTASVPPVPTATLAPTQPPQIALGEVVFAADIDAATGGPAAPATSLGRSTPTIRAFVQTSALPAGTTIRADWSINGVAVPTLMQEFTLTADRPAGWIEVHLTLTDGEPWPSGALQVTITVDGATNASGSVQLSGF